MASRPLFKLLSELDALAPLVPSIVAMASAAPRAISLAASAMRDADAADDLASLGGDAFHHAVEATEVLWKHDDLLIRAGTQLRDAMEQAGGDPEIAAALSALKSNAGRLWDHQLERMLDRSLGSRPGDLAGAVRVAQAVTDKLLERALR